MSESTSTELELAAAPADPPARARKRRNQRGMTTAEYAVGTVAAAGFGGILFKILTDPQVRDALLRFVLWLISQFLQMKPF